MRYQGTKTLEVLEGAENYNSWIASSLLRYAKSPLIEIGAGIGNISEHVVCDKAVLTEVDQELLQILKERFYNKKHIQIKKYNVLDQPDKGMYGRFNSVLSVNVLEHIKDDQKALMNIHGLLKTGGKVLLLVPAKKNAYTKLDQNLGHYRRYEKKELEKKVTLAGFIVEKLYFFNFVGLLSWVIRDRVTKNNFQLSSSHIAYFDRVVPAIRLIESLVPVPIGISLICVARKK